MDKYDEIMRTLGRIEGRLDHLTGVPDRVSKLEQWQAWLKGGWAVLAAALSYVLKAGYGR